MTWIFAASIVGLVCSLLITLFTIRMQVKIHASQRDLFRAQLEITTRDGALLEVINLGKLDSEDPEKLDRVLVFVRRAKEHARETAEL